MMHYTVIICRKKNYTVIKQKYAQSNPNKDQRQPQYAQSNPNF
jgi:hypothetical protein